LTTKAKQAVMQTTHNETFNESEIMVKYGKALLRLILRSDAGKEGTANTLQASGTQKDVVYALDYFRSVYTDITIMNNQVHQETEMRAMFKAGFRYKNLTKIEQHVEALKREHSILMEWSRPSTGVDIIKLDTNGDFHKMASYTCEPKKALIAYIMQERGNINTWAYPEHIEGMKQLPNSLRWAYDLPNGDVLYAKATSEV
jgi:hypothetical protein